MLSLDPRIYADNLAALRERQPSVAGAIDTAGGPGAKLVDGRDGTPTFLIAGERGNEWLGGSSMPSITAEELLRGFAAGHENVIVPGILTGREVLHVVARLSRHAAVFVIERSAYHLQLVLRLHDYCSLIKRGQVVFLLEPEFEAQLTELFHCHAGYSIPARMLTIPHRTAAETSDLQRRIEHAGSQIARNQASLLARLRAKIDAASTERRVPSRAGVREVDFGGRPGPDRSPRVAILSAEASESTSRDAQRLEAALREIGWSCTCCVPDSPDRCHAAARLKAVADVGADFVLVVNGAAASLRALLPQELPIVSWLFPSARVPRAIESTVGSVDLFVASSRAQQAQLVTAGVPDEQVHYVGITAGGGVTPPSSDVSPELDVAVIGDVPADRAEAAGVTLSTHARLWNECLKVAAESVAKAKAPAATEVLERAQSRSGVTLREPRVRGEFVRKIEDRVMPGAFARHLVQELSKQFKVSLLGANWEDETRWNARTPGDAQWAYSVRNARWVVLPFFSAAAVQLAVDALSAGVQVALRAGNSPLTECHPELSGVAKSIRTFRHAREAVEIVRSQGAGGHGLAAALQRISINAKLTQVWELVREKSDAGRYHRIERRVCDSTAS